MTDAISSIKYQTLGAFTMLEQVGYNPDSLESSDGLEVALTDNDDDVVMLIGDDINIDAKGGNNTVCIQGDNANITAGDGVNAVGIVGDNGTITLGEGDNDLYYRGDNSNISVKDGDNNFRIYGDKASINAGYGTNKIGVIGDDFNLETTSDSSYVAFWGDKPRITVGKGTTVRTLDQAILNSNKFDDMEDAFVAGLSHFNSSQKVNSQITYDYSLCDDPLIAGLSDEDKEFINSHDMSVKQDGCPKYFIATNEDGVPTIYSYAYTYKGLTYYYPKDHHGEQDYKQVINTKKLVEAEANYDMYDDYVMVYSKNYEVDGCYMDEMVNYIENDKIKNVTTELTVAEGSAGKITGTDDTDYTGKIKTAYTFAEMSGAAFTNYERVNLKYYTSQVE